MGQLQRCRFLLSINLLYDSESKTVIVNNIVLDINSLQFRALHLLVEKERVTYEEFSLALFERKLDASAKRKIIQVMSEIRSQLGLYGVDVNNVRRRGYILQEAL